MAACARSARRRGRRRRRPAGAARHGADCGRRASDCRWPRPPASSRPSAPGGRSPARAQRWRHWWPPGAGRAGLGPRRGAPAPVRRVASRAGIPLGGLRGLDPQGMPSAPLGDLFDFAGAHADPDLDPDRPVDAAGYLRPTRSNPTGRAATARLASAGRWVQDVRQCPERAARRGRPPVGPRRSRSRRPRCCAWSWSATGCRSTGRVAERLIADAVGPRPSRPGRGRTHPARARRRGAAPRPRPGATRPAQPGPGARPAHRRRRRRPDHAGLRARAVPRVHPLVDALLRLAQAGADRDDVRLPVAGRARRRRRPAAGRVDRVRRGGRADDRAERPAQPAGRAAARGRGRARATSSCAPTSARSSLGCWPSCPATRRSPQATRADDLYAPVAARLGAPRPVAKVAVLAAMYGQRCGAAGQALGDLERAYPVAMGLLERAYERRGAAARRCAPTAGGSSRLRRRRRPGAARGPVRPQRASSRGRPPSCSRPGPRPCGIRSPRSGGSSCCACTTSCSCTCPEPAAHEVAARGRPGAHDSARRWAGTDAVRFVADVSVIRTWDEAKA